MPDVGVSWSMTKRNGSHGAGVLRGDLAANSDTAFASKYTEY